MTQGKKGAAPGITVKGPFIIIPEIIANQTTINVQRNAILEVWQCVIDACIDNGDARIIRVAVCRLEREVMRGVLYLGAANCHKIRAKVGD